MDTRLLLYSLSIACLSGVAFGLAPAFGATGQWISNPLRDSAGQTGGRARRRVHAALIVVQIALTVALLAGAALFVRTYAGLRGVVLGYDMSHLMTMRVYLSGTRYDEPTARERAIDELARRLTAVAGAHAATISDLIPLDDQGGSDAPARVEGRTFEEGREPTVHYAGVAGRWVETLDLRLLAGRTFRDEELGEKAPVALVNATLASAFWPGENAIGRRFRLAEDQDSPWLTVIGVVPSIRTVKLDENQETPPTAYLPHRFVSTRNYGIILRTASVPASVTADVRAVVRGFDPDLALFDVYPMAQVHWLSYWMYVMWGTMFGVLAAIAVIIAAVGVYGVVFFTVAQRTREIGLRVALGAQRRQVVLPIVREVALLTCAGVAAGIGGALFVTPVVESLLIGVTPNDPGGYILAAGLIALIVLVATWIPAWSASAVDPLIALRRE